MNEILEYKRLKRLIHTQPILENDLLLQDINDFGQQCNNKQLYSSLKRKYKWHRIYHPRHLPIGKATKEWIDQMSPLVSVIVPNYGHSLYLQERIESILNQTFQNFELIILDDCSPDNSRDVILKYKNHPRVSHIVFNEQNSGNTFLQWEKGVALAKGRYIWIAESDDYADETFLDCVMTMFCLYEDCVMARTGSYITNEKGRIQVRDWDLWKEDETIHYYKGKDYIRHNMLHFNFVYNASMVVFRKDVFQKIDKSYQRLRYTGDWQCWIEMLMHGPICEYRRKLNYFRQHQNKVSMRSTSTNKGIIDQINVLAYVVKKMRLSPLCKLMVKGEQYHISTKWFYGDYNSPVRKTCFETLKNNLRATRWHYCLYKVLSLFDFFPFIPSRENDKYK